MSAAHRACRRISGFAPSTWLRAASWASDAGHCPNRVPLYALLVSSAGLVVAIVLNLVTANVYVKLFGIAIFGGIFVWIMIFVSFLRFRPRWANAELPFRAPFYPYLPILGAATLTAILVTMLINPDWRFAWEAGVPFLVFLLIVYFIVYGLRRKEEVEPHERVGS